MEQPPWLEISLAVPPPSSEGQAQHDLCLLLAGGRLVPRSVCACRQGESQKPQGWQEGGGRISPHKVLGSPLLPMGCS